MLSDMLNFLHPNVMGENLPTSLDACCKILKQRIFNINQNNKSSLKKILIQRIQRSLIITKLLL